MRILLRTRGAVVAVLLGVLGVTGSAVGQFGNEAVSVSAVSSLGRVYRGEQIAVAVIMEHSPGYHTWPSEAQDVLPDKIAELAIRTELVVGAMPAGASFESGERIRGELPSAIGMVGPIQWPEPFPAMVADPSGGPDAVEVPTYQDRAVVYVPMIVSDDAALGAFDLALTLYFQACDESACLMPEAVTLSVPIEVVETGAVRDAARGAGVFGGLDQSVWAEMLSGAGSLDEVGFNVFGWKFSIDPNSVFGMALLLLVASVSGFILNLTPCVLPVVPLKIMGLSQSAGNRARVLYLGLVMSMGVVSFFVAIGGAIAFISGFSAISSLFQTGWFGILVGVVIAGLALGMFGAFTTQLPQWVYRITPRHDSTVGSFGWGVLIAVLSTPCTGPFMGAASAWATRQTPALTMMTFGAIGVGMALPYLILAANPRWINKIPRSGPASELVKQVMGLFLLGIAIFFIGAGIGPYITEPPAPAWMGYWWAAGAFGVLASGWLAYRTIKITRRVGPRVIWVGLAGFVAMMSVLVAVKFTDHGPIDWEYYTPSVRVAAMERGDVMVTDFTANWCLNCKAIEAAILFNPRVAKVLNGAGVTAIKVDLTGKNKAGSELHKRFNWVGIPLLVIEGPGLDEPIRFGDGYTVDMVLGAIEQAGGSGSGRASSRAGRGD